MLKAICVLLCITLTNGHGYRRQAYFMEGNCTMGSIDNRFKSCPSGFCCAYDEFFRQIYYCKEVGKLNDGCSTVRTDSDCPCGTGLHCQSNLVSSSFVSIYGHCKENPGSSTSEPQNSTTTPTSFETSTLVLTTNDNMPITSEGGKQNNGHH